MLTYRSQFPAEPIAGTPLLVLLHGRGADETDLLALASYLPPVLLVSVRAPYPAAPWGYGPGYAWYRFLGGTRPDPGHYQHSLDELDALLTALPGVLPVRPGPLFLGGFSQGGTVSLGYALSHPGRVHTVLNLSGFLADHPAVKVTPETVAATRFYWPHGLRDGSIPHANARQGRSQLAAAGAFLVAPDFDIDHRLIREEIDDIGELVRNV